MLERVARRPFDAILVADDGAAEVVGGMSLLERTAWTLARAGARRLLLTGTVEAWGRRPPIRVEHDVALDRWLEDLSGPVVVVRGTMVADPDTVAAFVFSDSPGPIRTADGCLQRIDPTDSSPTFAANGETSPSPDTPLWTPPQGALLVRAADAASRARAEQALYARLGRSGDGWFTRLVDRRLSRALTRLLLPTGVGPNTVTVASIAIGVAGGLCFATGAPTAAFAGALLFLASTIVDGCDGEIARLTFRETAFGAKLDILGDNLVHLFLFGGIAVGLYRRSGDPVIAVLGPTLLFGVLLAMATVYLSVIRRQPNPAQRALFEAFASREFAYLLVVLTLVGRLDWFLWLSAVGTYVFSGGLFFLGRRSG